MKLIVAVDANWAIGNKGELLTHLPADLKYFKEKTSGAIVVMGRKTLESLPGAKPLPNRTNIILTTQQDYQVADAIVVHSVAEAKATIIDCVQPTVFIIGGEAIYRSFLNDCEEALVTKIDATFEADTYFPNLDQDPAWQCVEESELQDYESLRYRWTIYRQISSQQD